MKNFAKAICIVVFVLKPPLLCFGQYVISTGQLSSVDTSVVFLLNQVGYTPSATKIALIKVKADKFLVVEAESGKVVFTATPGKPEYWSFSGDTVCIADFSSVIEPGKYRLCIEGNIPCSYEFSIKKDVYNGLSKASMKAFYFNRASEEITREFGGKWARPGGHPDTAVIVHESAASQKRPAGTVISSPGGWYDAGDYNKYIVNSGITIYTLLLFYQMYPDYCNSLNVNIPESSNDVPDVLDEMLYNLKWMLTMQDPDDGGVYHKLTNKGFDGFVMPDKATQPRYVVMKSTAATLDFAAVMAMASRVFVNNQNAELQALSKTCFDAANKAMSWAKSNPRVYYKQPKDIHTGLYADTVLEDEFFWAKAELALANKERTLVSIEDIEKRKLFIPSWGKVEFLGIISLAFSNDPQFRYLQETASKRLIAFTDELLAKSQSSAFRVSLDTFKWGSNCDIINQTILKLVTFRLTGDKKYLPSIQADVDYILGKNATGYCFVTGFGTRSPMHIHHRPSVADGVTDPVPGFLVGGPTNRVTSDCGNKAYRSKLPAKSYLDAECSFSTNEIAINWNAALFFVIGALDAMSQAK